MNERKYQNRLRNKQIEKCRTIRIKKSKVAKKDEVAKDAMHFISNQGRGEVRKGRGIW